MEWYLGPLKKYAEFSGRASRKELWLFLLINTVVYLILAAIFIPVAVIYAFGAWLPAISVQVRRLHDTNRSGGWWWLQVVPIIGTIIVFVWFVTKGTDGDNDYGPDPLASAAATPGPVLTDPGSGPPAPLSGPQTASKTRRPAGSSDAPSAPPPAPRQRPIIKMNPDTDQKPFE